VVTDAIRRRVAGELPADAQPHALAALERMAGELAPWKVTETDRVEHAVLDLAAGDLERLEHWVAEALVDWRDVLVAAGR
jgi:hypothetical protein